MENNVIPLDYLFYLRIQRKKYKELLVSLFEKVVQFTSFWSAASLLTLLSGSKLP